MRTTIVVAVHYKVDAEGDTADELIRNAVEIAHGVSEAGSKHIVGVRVESAQALVNREALDDPRRDPRHPANPLSLGL